MTPTHQQDAAFDAPRHSRAQPVKAWSLFLVLAITLTACRSPRDPDLDRRMSEAEIERALPKPAKEEQAATPPPKKAVDEAAAKHGLPPAGSVELRTYSDKEIAAALDSVPGSNAGKATPPHHYSATFDTSEGVFSCRLDHAEAPQAVTNFIGLTHGLRAWRDPDTKEIVERRFYDGLTFHRAIKDFIIQTGNPGTGASSGPGWTISREEGNADRYDAPGAMGMVDAGEETHGSQFFITLRGQKSLKGKYTPFGVCSPLDVIRRIANGEKHEPSAKGKSATKPTKPVRLKRVSVTRVPAPSPTPPAAPSAQPTTATP